ncbi:protein matrimony-like isoform X2 [Episyrphus balteatus]|uniref:protein matrimony-like isoform X2 n=1 Tax=Episyrphus balteatus TaxID=286459 RepID=UPI0024860BC0|nr:protein matrimony-like isoform X2 [Episyrphus balteatus]
MPFEINDGRTPPAPAMMLTTVQTRSTPRLERNSPHGHNRQFKDVSNLKVNQRRSRSFTPVKGDFYLRSPELSPIDATINRQHTPDVCRPTSRGDSSVLEQSLTPGDYNVLENSLTPVEFKVPTPIVRTNDGTTPTRSIDHHHVFGREGIQFEDPNQTQSLDKSASHGYLNHKLEVRLILKNAGMQQYIKAFDKEKMDFGKFLSLCEEDLLRLGVKRKMDRKVIFSIINDLNAN